MQWPFQGHSARTKPATYSCVHVIIRGGSGSGGGGGEGSGGSGGRE